MVLIFFMYDFWRAFYLTIFNIANIKVTGNNNNEKGSISLRFCGQPRRYKSCDKRCISCEATCHALARTQEADRDVFFVHRWTSRNDIKAPFNTQVRKYNSDRVPRAPRHDANSSTHFSGNTSSKENIDEKDIVRPRYYDNLPKQFDDVIDPIEYEKEKERAEKERKEKEIPTPRYQSVIKNFLFDAYCNFVGEDSISSTFKKWFLFKRFDDDWLFYDAWLSSAKRDWLLKSLKTAKAELFFVLVLLFFISLVALLGLASYMDMPYFDSLITNYFPVIFFCMIVLLGLMLLVTIWIMTGVSTNISLNPDSLCKYLSAYKYFVSFAFLLDFVVFVFLDKSSLSLYGYLMTHVPYLLFSMLLPLLLHLIYTLKAVNLFDLDYGFDPARESVDMSLDFYTCFVMIKHTIVFMTPYVYSCISGNPFSFWDVLCISGMFDISMFFLFSCAVMGLERTFQSFLFLIFFFVLLFFSSYLFIWLAGWIGVLILKTLIVVNTFPYSLAYRRILVGSIGQFVVSYFPNFTGIDAFSDEVIQMISYVVFAFIILYVFFYRFLPWVHSVCMVVNKVYLTKEWSNSALNKELCSLHRNGAFIGFYYFFVYLFVSLLTRFIPRDWHLARTLLTYLFCLVLLLLICAFALNVVLGGGGYLYLLDTIFHM
jgi:hypothetical protein